MSGRVSISTTAAGIIASLLLHAGIGVAVWNAPGFGERTGQKDAAPRVMYLNLGTTPTTPVQSPRPMVTTPPAPSVTPLPEIRPTPTPVEPPRPQPTAPPPEVQEAPLGDASSTAPPTNSFLTDKGAEGHHRATAAKTDQAELTRRPGADATSPGAGKGPTPIPGPGNASTQQSPQAIEKSPPAPIDPPKPEPTRASDTPSQGVVIPDKPAHDQPTPPLNAEPNLKPTTPQATPDKPTPIEAVKPAEVTSTPPAPKPADTPPTQPDRPIADKANEKGDTERPGPLDGKSPDKPGAAEATRPVPQQHTEAARPRPIDEPRAAATPGNTPKPGDAKPVNAPPSPATDTPRDQPVPTRKPLPTPSTAPAAPTPQPAAAGGGGSIIGESGARSDRESPATSVSVEGEYRNGRVSVGKGLDLRTRRPSLSVIGQMSVTGRPVVVEFAINKAGEVVAAKVLASSGLEELDRQTVAAIYTWEASGLTLDELPDTPDARVRVTMRVYYY